MAIRKIVTAEDPVIRQRAKKVNRIDRQIFTLIEDMFETMHDAPGVGLAAPQVGVSLQVIVAEYQDRAYALINPEIVKSGGELRDAEGCLSLPGWMGDEVKRYEHVTVRGLTPEGKEVRFKLQGYWARIMQHEIDHLSGTLYIDHLEDAEKQLRRSRRGERADEEGLHDDEDEPEEEPEETTTAEHAPARRRRRRR